MKPDTIKKLCCPFDHADLRLTIIVQEVDGDVKEGFFTCTACHRIYPIVMGVPIMSPDEYREFQLEKPLLDKWSAHLEGLEVDERFRIMDKSHMPQ